MPETDWSAVFGDADRESTELKPISPDVLDALGPDFRAVAARARDLAECRDLAEQAMDAAHESQERADAAHDSAESARDAAVYAHGQLEGYRRAATVNMWLDVGVLIAAVAMLVMTIINFWLR